jgi:hypothetical protein
LYKSLLVGRATAQVARRTDGQRRLLGRYELARSEKELEYVRVNAALEETSRAAAALAGAAARPPAGGRRVERQRDNRSAALRYGAKAFSRRRPSTAAQGLECIRANPRRSATSAACDRSSTPSFARIDRT